MIPIPERLLQKIPIPSTVHQLLSEENSTLLLSISGGVDSQAKSKALIQLHELHDWKSEIRLVHADLGRAEWPITLPFIQKQSQTLNIPLDVVHHPKYGSLQTVWSGTGWRQTLEYDLIDHIWDNLKNRGESWPSALARFCTSDHKTRPISSYIIKRWAREHNIICAMGLLAVESKKREEKDPFTERKKTYSIQKKRFVYDWLPMHQFTKAEIWEIIGYSREELYQIRKETRHAFASGSISIESLLDTFAAHPAYAFGNTRLSCILCVLGNTNDLRNGIKHNPETFHEYAEIELQGQYSFKNDLSLAQLEPDLLQKSQKERLAEIEQHNPRFKPIYQKDRQLELFD